MCGASSLHSRAADLFAERSSSKDATVLQLLARMNEQAGTIANLEKEILA